MEANQDVVTIQGVNGDILQALISFCYTGKININKRNVDELLAAATSMEFMQIEKLCEKFYLRSLWHKTALGLWLLAEQYNLVELKAAAEAIIMKHFQILAHGKEFRELKVDTLKWLLQNDRIYVYSEEEVFNAVVRWIEFDEEQRNSCFVELVSLVRVQFINKMVI